jgi:hypothetical protein
MSHGNIITGLTFSRHSSGILGSFQSLRKMFANWFGKGLLNLINGLYKPPVPRWKGHQACLQTICQCFRAIHELFRALYELFSVELRTDIMTWHYTPTHRQTDKPRKAAIWRTALPKPHYKGNKKSSTPHQSREEQHIIRDTSESKKWSSKTQVLSEK